MRINVSLLSTFLLAVGGFFVFSAEAQQIDKPDLIQSFPVGASPRGRVFDGANIWITSDTIPNLTKLRASDGASLGGIEFPRSNKIGVSFFGGRYLASKSDIEHLHESICTWIQIIFLCLTFQIKFTQCR